MRVRVGVLLALAISGLFVPGSLSPRGAPLIVTVQVDPLLAPRLAVGV